MPQLSRGNIKMLSRPGKRRAPADESESSTPQPTQRQRQRPRLSQSPASSAPSDEDGNLAENLTTSTHQSLVKHLVRLALASEYSRTPLRRADITTKILTPNGAGARVFRSVFDDAQLALRHTFGMELVELPAREKVTIAQRRKAGQSTQNTQTASTKSWILVSTLPDTIKGVATELLPSKAPTRDIEAEYAGLCTIIVGIIALSGGVLSQNKLDRSLHRMNAERTTPVDKTDKLLQRMIKEGYITRTRENNQGEELIDYRVGPRGKIEIGEKGVAGLVRQVYGQSMENEELEERLERSLKVSGISEGMTQGVQTNGEGPILEPLRRRGRPRRNASEDD